MRIAIYVILGFLFLGLATQGWTSERLRPLKVRELCEYYKYTNCNLVVSIAMVESSLNPNAYAEGEDAYGLCQIKCSTARKMGLKYSCKQLFSPKINLRFAIKYLEYLSERRGAILERHLIAGYNAGRVRYCKSLKANKWLGSAHCIPGQLINEFYVYKVTRILNYLRGV